MSIRASQARRGPSHMRSFVQTKKKKQETMSNTTFKAHQTCIYQKEKKTHTSKRKTLISQTYGITSLCIWHLQMILCFFCWCNDMHNVWSCLHTITANNQLIIKCTIQVWWLKNKQKRNCNIILFALFPQIWLKKKVAFFCPTPTPSATILRNFVGSHYRTLWWLYMYIADMLKRNWTLFCCLLLKLCYSL